MSGPNGNGVYEPGECLTLHRQKKGWQGVAICEIMLLDKGERWLWAVSYHLFTGDHSGYGEPIHDHPRRAAASRDEAIDAASAWLRGRLADRAAEYPDARAIIDWLDTLRPDQFSLFGAAA